MSRHNYDPKYMSHTYTLKYETHNFTVEISPSTNYGYFEHNKGGEGGLWFEDKFLIDYDGVSVLPDEVYAMIQHLGYSFDPQDLNDTQKNFDWGILYRIQGKFGMEPFNTEVEIEVGSISEVASKIEELGLFLTPRIMELARASAVAYYRYCKNESTETYNAWFQARVLEMTAIREIAT